MANFFDQFDPDIVEPPAAPAADGGNFFDQFDSPSPPPVAEAQSTPASIGKQIVYGANRSIVKPLADIASGNITVAGKKLFEPWAPAIAETAREKFYPEEPATTGERVASRAGEFIPETLAAGAGTTMALGKALAEPAKSVGGVVARALLTPYAGGASKARVAADAAGAAGAGAASQGYREAAGDDASVGGELTAGLAGGVAAGTLPGAAATVASKTLMGRGATAIKELATSLLPEAVTSRVPALAEAQARQEAAQRTRAMPTVAKMFEGAAAPEAQASIAEAEALRQQIPGFNPTLAEATGLPSAVATQRTIESRAVNADLDKLAQRRAGSEAAVDRYRASEAPKGEDAGLPQRQLQGKVSQVRQAIARQEGEASQAGANVAAQLPQADRYATGEALRDRMMDLREATSKRMSLAAKNLGISDTAPVPFDKLRARVGGAIPSEFADKQILGETIGKIADAPKGQAATFGDVKFLRERLGDEIRVAQREHQRAKARVLIGARDQIDAFLDQDVMPGNTAYKQFRETYRRDYIDRFEKGAARYAKALGPDNDFRTAAEDVASDFWGPGKITNIKQFKETFGGDQQANDLLRASALDDLRRGAVRDGQIDPRALNAWVRRHAEVLAELPDLQKEVADIGKASQAVSRRLAQLRERRERVEDLRLVRSLGKQPEATMDLALKDPAAAAAMARKMDDQGRSAMARLMWDRASSQGSAKDIGQFVDANAKSLSPFLSTQHMNALKTIAKAQGMHDRLPAPEGRAGEADPMKFVKETVGTGPAQVLSRVFAAESGRTSVRYVLSDLLARAGITMSQKQAQEISRQAIYDLKFARDLADFINLPKGENQQKRMRAWALTLGLNTGDRDDGGQPAKPARVTPRSPSNTRPAAPSTPRSAE